MTDIPTMRGIFLDWWNRNGYDPTKGEVEFDEWLNHVRETAVHNALQEGIK